MNFFRTHLLSIILFTPVVGALVLLFVNKHKEDAIRWIANIFAFAGFLVSIPLWFRYEPAGEAIAHARRTSSRRSASQSAGNSS